VNTIKDMVNIAWRNAMEGKNAKVVRNDMDYYAEAAWQTAIYPDAGKDLNYPVIGLLSEAGEVAGEAKRVLRDDGGKLTKERRAAIAKELGDVLWYVAACAKTIGVSLSTIATMNLVKLNGRKQRGQLKGKGGERGEKPRYVNGTCPRCGAEEYAETDEAIHS
jgi:NTP pyrophosphatase (non-canonical NTP hydrolase)